MKTSARKRTLIIVLLIMAVIFSIFVFFIPFQKNGTFWTAYTAEILAFLMQIPVFGIMSGNSAKRKSKVLGIPVLFAGYMYLGIQTAVSLILIVFGTLTAFPVWLAVIICAIIFVSGIICGNTADDEVHTQLSGDKLMKTLCMKTERITLKASDDDSRHMLELVTESFRYSSPVSNKNTREIELRLKNIVSQLDKAVSEKTDIVELCAEIAQLLNTRNDICRMSEQ